MYRPGADLARHRPERRGARGRVFRAEAAIDQPLLTDSSGRFDLAGTHTREHGGPIRIGEKEDKRPARYTGTTDGRTMTLTVALAGSNEPLGTFTLTHGKIGRIVKCL